jgi:hypothetical protein
VTGRPAVFVATFFLSVFTVTGSISDSYTITDSLATNALVIAVWLLLRSSREPRDSDAWGAGAVFVYAVFLRPFFLPLIAVAGAFIWRSWPAKARLRAIMLFLAIPFLAEASWTARNFLLLGRVVPLQAAGLPESRAERAVWEWAQSFGGDIVFWRPGTVMAWLLRNPQFVPENLPVPPGVLTPECGAQRVGHAARLYRAFRNERDPARRAELEPIIVEEFDDCRDAYVAAHPFDHHVVARLRLLRSLLGHSGAVLPMPRFSELSPASVPANFKILTAATYALVLTFGAAGLLLLIRLGTPAAWLIAVLPSYFLVLFPLVLRRVETRYIVGPWPFLCISAAVALVAFARWISGVCASRSQPDA